MDLEKLHRLFSPTWDCYSSPYNWFYVFVMHRENITILGACHCPLCLHDRAMQAAFYRE